MQTKAEREALLIAWESQPEVIELRQQIINYVLHNDLQFDIAGLNATAEFIHEWLREHGPLPPSGIQIG